MDTTVLVFGVLCLFQAIHCSNSNINGVTFVTRLTPQVLRHFTKFSAQGFVDASTPYGNIELLFSDHKITGASTDDVIFALIQFARNHPDMRAHANSAIANVRGMLPGAEILVYVRHNGEQNGE